MLIGASWEIRLMETGGDSVCLSVWVDCLAVPLHCKLGRRDNVLPDGVLTNSRGVK